MTKGAVAPNTLKMQMTETQPTTETWKLTAARESNYSKLTL